MALASGWQQSISMSRLLIGASDKTNLLLHFAASDFPRGLLLVDPDGSVAEATANAVPKPLLQNVFYLDPSDLNHPFGLNILDHIPPDERHTLTENICAYFEAMWPNGWGAQSNFILANCLRILLDTPGSTLLGVLKLLTDEGYQKKCLAYCTDPVVVANWKVICRWDSRQYQAALAPLQNKIGTLLMSPTLRNIFGQQHSTFSLAQNKIIIANLCRAKIGDLTAFLLGSLLVSRSAGPVYINGLGFFSSDRLAGQSTRTDFTVAVDFLDELAPKLRQAVVQFREKYVFQTNREDAEKLAFYVGVANPSLLVDLSPAEYKALAGEPTIPPAPAFRQQLKGIKKRSQACHTRPRVAVEGRIRDFLGA
jgi:hypothetical protein